MTSSSLAIRIASLPKAELHLHLEGSIQPATVCALAARHGILIAEEEVRRRYAYRGFSEFIEAFKWVTSFLREPQDYALIARRLCGSDSVGQCHAPEKAAAGSKFRSPPPRHRAIRKPRLAIQLDLRRRSAIWAGSRAGRG